MDDNKTKDEEVFTLQESEKENFNLDILLAKKMEDFTFVDFFNISQHLADHYEKELANLYRIEKNVKEKINNGNKTEKIMNNEDILFRNCISITNCFYMMALSELKKRKEKKKFVIHI